VGDSEASCESAGELLGIAVLGEATQIVVPNGVYIPSFTFAPLGLVDHSSCPSTACAVRCILARCGWCLAGLFSILKHNPALLVMHGRGGELCQA
jgi:hypothetical protein